MNNTKKTWSGRFETQTDESMNSFHSSISFDNRLYKHDILGSIAHAKMLGKQNIIAQEDADLIVSGLEEILLEIQENKIDFKDSKAEDIHMFVEELLTQKIGVAGKKVHTGRSRNDQVALDMRLFMLEANSKINQSLLELCNALVLTAEQNLDTIMPGYTHMQKAQPITLAHHIMAYYEMFSRDISRINDCRARTGSMPLGAGALATSTYNINRKFVSNTLGFSNICQNSLDAVSDRDFCIEFCSCASIIMMHLSRFCEELILWSTDEFRFVEMSDGYSTGSSIMPQKKNPDVAELIRGKTGRVYGDLTALLSMMKSLPLAYNKDMQEDKEATFDAFDTTLACLSMFTKMFSTMSFNKKIMHDGANRGFTNATDAADYLVKNGVAFRDAHEIIGKLVLHCIKNNTALDQLSLEAFQSFSSVFKEDIFQEISLETCVSGRSVAGGPAPCAVQEHINIAKIQMLILIPD